MKKNTAKTLSTQLVYVDLKTIQANYLNPDFWGKEWPIFKWKEITVYWKMTNIDVGKKIINSEVLIHDLDFRKGSRTFKCHWMFPITCRPIPLKHGEYTQKTLNRNILGTLLDLIEAIERCFIREYAEYQEAERVKEAQDKAATEEAKKIVEDFAKQNGLNGSMTKALIESFTEEFLSDKYKEGELVDFPRNVMSSYRYTVIGPAFLLACSWFGSQERYDEYKKLVHPDRGHSWSALRKQLKTIQTDEWLNGMALAAAEKLKDE